MKLVVDMNLPPGWVDLFQQQGWEAVHWSAVGDPRATDRVILDWARSNGHVVFTHDLDFGTLLALAGDAGPSVFQVRTQDVMPARLGAMVLAALRQHAAVLESGALVSLDETHSRARILPFD